MIVKLLCAVALVAATVPASAPDALFVKSSAAQGDTAKANYWLSPCPADRRNLPPSRPEEQA